MNAIRHHVPARLSPARTGCCSPRASSRSMAPRGARPVAAGGPRRPGAAVAGARQHGGGEATLMLPDLGAGAVPAA